MMSDEEAALIDLEARIDDEIKRIAAKWREKVLLPYCRRKRVTCLFGNGTWYFESARGVDVTDRLPKSIVDTLNLPVPTTNRDGLLGYYVEDVRRADIKRIP